MSFFSRAPPPATTVRAQTHPLSNLAHYPPVLGVAPVRMVSCPCLLAACDEVVVGHFSRLTTRRLVKLGVGADLHEEVHEIAATPKRDLVDRSCSERGVCLVAVAANTTDWETTTRKNKIAELLSIRHKTQLPDNPETSRTCSVPSSPNNAITEFRPHQALQSSSRDFSPTRPLWYD